MRHKIAKLLLEHAGSFLERQEAVRQAVSLGMPLAEIEEYLDWLDATRGDEIDSGQRQESDASSSSMRDGGTADGRSD